MLNFLSVMTQFHSFIPRIDRVGIFFFVITFCVGMLSFTLDHKNFASFFATLSFLMLYFYRDPARIIPIKSGIVVSPSEGVIDLIEFNVPIHTANPDIIASSELFTKISIRLDIFDIHVNRVPVKNSSISDIRNFNGSFIGSIARKGAPSFSKNNKNSCHIFYEIDKDGLRAKKDYIVVAMITGIVARRIICRANKGDKPAMGERVGIICFGSQCDIYISNSYKICVGKGQRVVGGETIVALENKNVSIYDNVEYASY